MNWTSQFKNNQISAFVPLLNTEYQTKQNSFSQIYKTPIKEPDIPEKSDQKNNLFTPSPFQIDFNFYFGNLFSSGRIPVPHLEGLSSSNHNIKNSSFFDIKNNSFSQSDFKVSPNSEYKNLPRSLNITNSINKTKELNSTLKIINNENMTINSVNRVYTEKNENENDYHCYFKKNLSNMFEQVKDGNNYLVKGNNKMLTNGNNYNSYQNIIMNENVNVDNNNLYVTPIKQIGVNNEKLNLKKNVVFQCSESTNTNTSLVKKKRFRKNQEQIKKLSFFYHENKDWTKGQVKKISDEIGLKENKVYKWLWDQKNKDFKRMKFHIKK